MARPMKIHPTAIVDPSAQLAEDVEVGPWAVVEGDVTIGPGSKLWPRAFVGRWTEIGRECQVHMGAIVGHEPQDVSYKGDRSFLKVGDRNVFREYSFIHRGARPDTSTVLGDDNWLMAYPQNTGVPSVDITPAACTVHQEVNPPSGISEWVQMRPQHREEMKQNRNLFLTSYNIKQGRVSLTPWVLGEGGLRKRK